MKLAFLFLIYDIILQEELWEQFFRGVDPAKYTILIHYKWQKPLKYFEQYKIDTCIPTKYVTDTSIGRAQLMMIEAAFNDPSVYKTINLSQSCIPLKSFDHVYEFLTRDTMSHFNTMPMSDWSIAVTECATQYVPRPQIHKAANWFILNRAHATACVEHPEYFTYFEHVHSPEEFMFLTLLKAHRPEEIQYTHYSAEGATTFTNWDQAWGMVYKYPCYASIKTYETISEEELLYLIESPCLFGRKFTASCTVGDRLLRDYPFKFPPNK